MAGSRREFLFCAAAVSAVLLSGVASAASARHAQEADAEPLKVLFLGGTGFLGPHTVERLMKRGHEVTLFNRGNRGEMFPDLELIEGNRIVSVEPGLEPLREAIAAGRTWDVVIDTASVHTWTENSAELLKDAADHYVYISSLSVYADSGGDGRKEGDALAVMPDEVADSIDRLPYDMHYYGAVKARSEAAAEKAFPGRTTVLRPGLLVGPRDYTHRFTYWPWRVRQGGEVLAPGSPTDPVMFIDVRDVADFIVKTIENKTYGVFNVNGPVSRDLTMGKLLETCREVTGSDASFTWVDGGFLAERGINAWQQMPVWVPPEGESAGFHLTHVSASGAAGLTTRPLEETIRDTLSWFDAWLPEVEQTRGYEFKPGENTPGVSKQTEEKVLTEWESHEP